jgi:hypothetical protein
MHRIRRLVAQLVAEPVSAVQTQARLTQPPDLDRPLPAQFKYVGTSGSFGVPGVPLGSPHDLRVHYLETRPDGTTRKLVVRRLNTSDVTKVEIMSRGNSARLSLF